MNNPETTVENTQPKRKRGRQKGSKNRPKVDIAVDTTPVKLSANQKRVQKLKVYVASLPDSGESLPKDCLDCDKFLKCKKTYTRNFQPCEEFMSIYPTETEEDSLALDVVEDPPELLYVCKGAVPTCKGCPHAIPHAVFGDLVPCNEYSFCEDVKAIVRCEPVATIN